MLAALFYFIIGIAIFIAGILTLTTNLRSISKNKVKYLIDKFTGNMSMSIIIGFFTTLILQSSSIVSILAVGMADAGLLNLYSAAGIIMGSNIGTTIAVQLYAFNLFHLAPYAVLAGSILHFQKKSLKLKLIGNTILGFGIIFYGLEIMNLSAVPLRHFENITLFLDKLSNPMIAVITGIIAALIMQSSNIGIAMMQSLASSGILSLSSIIPVVYGLNIGTCSEAIIMSFTTNKEGKKIALFNIFFNIAGTIIFMPFTQYFAVFLKFLSPENPARQIANAHMLFNILSIIFIVPIIRYIFILIDKLINLFY
ncbi:Na/Pi cotransporter family protein [Aceticella autotrophica]|uniref:Na/Pi cotransporter family protein n=1 Tax=Aceticella autotrophica TaxID=2755338 RepID=A0A975AUQ1_9THEO|nr:Na/Pi symporter [Aceticella autotrophica]QSZ26793.1 Na/Pi cotransporter family protein [Aceticella autotrophica]